MSWANQYTIGETVKVAYGEFEGQECIVQAIGDTGEAVLVEFVGGFKRVYWSEDRLIRLPRHKRPISAIFYPLQM